METGQGFSMESFVMSPTVDELLTLRKVDLLQVADQYKVEHVKNYMRKSEILGKTIKWLVHEEVLPPDALRSILESPADDPQARSGILDAEVRLQEIELEKARVELERERISLERAHVTVGYERDRVQARYSPPHFDVAKHVKMVPIFEEDNVDRYFLHFERVAESMEWPIEKWTHLLQFGLKGKARDAYAAIPPAEACHYETVKFAILQAYALTPEAYRQKFRNTRKQESQTYREFAKTKEIFFDRWCQSVRVDTFEDLRELVLLEEFKRSLPHEIHTHLEESKVAEVAQAATLSDDYVLTHRQFSRNGTPGNRYRFPKRNDNQINGGKIDKPALREMNKSEREKGSKENERLCYQCGKPGHMKANCPALQKNKLKSFPNGLVSGLVQNQTSDLHVRVQEVFKSAEPEKIQKQFEPFMSIGYVSLTESDEARRVKILRDTGASQSLILESVLPFSVESATGTKVLLQGVGDDFIEVPLHSVDLQSDLVSGEVTLGVRPSLPIPGASIILGNDLAGGRVSCSPIVVEHPGVNESVDTKRLVEEFPDVFPACVITRSMAKRMSESESETSQCDVDLSDSFFCQLVDYNPESRTSSDSKKSDMKVKVTENSDSQEVNKTDSVVVNKSRLIEEQEKDVSLVSLSEEVLSEEEATDVPVCYYKRGGVLMRKWRPPDVPVDEVWKEVHQIVVPVVYRQDIIGLAHDAPLSGHLGVKKTQEKILSHFFWPGLRGDVADYCRSCRSCQVVGKPNQTIPVAPLKPIPAFDEPFTQIIVDCVGPLPRTKSGHEYLLTIMCAATRYAEAIPLRRITAKSVTQALVKFFTMVGLPKTVRSDQGSNFMSKVFKQVLDQLGVTHVSSSAYHPQSQGALERFHQTLKNMLKTYCFEQEREWDEGVPLLLFAARESVQESLGFSPFELVFGHTVRGPLKLLKERMLSEESNTNLLEYVSTFRERLRNVCEVAKKNLSNAQSKMKTWYDKKSKARSFQPGDQVLVLLPVTGHCLHARYAGPYTVTKKVSEVDYIVNTPDRQKQKRLCHVNMLKLFIERNKNDELKPVVCAVNATGESEVSESHDSVPDREWNPDVKLKNSDVLSQLGEKLCHLSSEKQREIKELIGTYPQLFGDVPTRTGVVTHDVDVGDSTPVKQHPYRAGPAKMHHIRCEVEYMLENNIIEPSKSAWSSPCILVPKPDGSHRFCTDYRKVNSCTKTDSYPMPRVDDCIDKIGNAKFVSKFDMLKGYWQIPLSERAKEISAFTTPIGLFQYAVMPFGMKNASATFQRMVNELIGGLEGCEAYIDDVVVYADNWEDHVERIRALFERLSAANLTVNLIKSEFGCAEVQFLGHVVGCGSVKPVSAQVEAVKTFPPPANKKELMRFLGMAGFYRRFCQNFSDVVAPLTNILRKDTRFQWSAGCQDAFDRVKAILSTSPVLAAPDFNKPFSLAVDASDVGAGAVLMQADDAEVDRPVCYFSKKFNSGQRNYSTVEKETLALILALQHFDVYVGNAPKPVIVWTDHNPLTFVARMKNKNQRLTRWSIILQEQTLDIRHIRGKNNVVADALSRV